MILQYDEEQVRPSKKHADNMMHTNNEVNDLVNAV